MSNQSNFCMIYYYVPEDLDDPEVPNAFGINKPQENLTITQIKNAFPLEGEYYFRFKLKVNNSQIVWMDINNDQSKIPTFQGRIFMKVTRISWNKKIEQENKVQSDQKASISAENTNGQNTQKKPEIQQFSIHDNDADFLEKQKQQHQHKHALSDNSAPEKVKAQISQNSQQPQPQQLQQQQVAATLPENKQQQHKTSNLLDMDLF